MRKTAIVENGPAVHRDNRLAMKIPSGDDESFEYEPMTARTIIAESIVEKPKVASVEILSLPEV